MTENFDPDEPAAELTTRDGWSRFVHQGPSAVQLLPEHQWQALTGQDRENYDDARMAHHSTLAIIATPTVNEVGKMGKRLTLLNRGQLSALRGLIVTGAAGTGKTTAITQLGKHHEIHTRRRRSGPAAAFLPVVYVIVPPSSTPKMLISEFARFLGLPLPNRSNQVAITNMVCDVLRELGTELVLVDEIHRLELSTRGGAESSDQLKYLADRIAATFVYAGIDVEAHGLLSGSRGRQIAARFATIQTQPFAYGTRIQRDHWAALVMSLEQLLRLHRHRPSALLDCAEYLYQRTGGMIGSLSHLVREAAILAILDGTEAITNPP